MSDEYYTVVFRVKGGKDQHQAWWHIVHPLFLCDDAISITTIAAGDLISEATETLRKPETE